MHVCMKNICQCNLDFPENAEMLSSDVEEAQSLKVSQETSLCFGDLGAAEKSLTLEKCGVPLEMSDAALSFGIPLLRQRTCKRW